MFVDELNLTLCAGKGGDGCTSFRREKYVPMGGPDGGNGGRGASIIFKTDRNLTTLIDLSYKKTIKGDKGENGKGSNKYGKNASDVIVKVPVGTTIIDIDTNEVIADLTSDSEEVIVAHGGRGGRGNKAFAHHDNPAPHFSELGAPGEVVHVKVELKVLADVGLIGMPSVGKSTLLSVISASKPKIAAYHFTTLSPNLGVVKLMDGSSFVMADLPGIIEGAHTGAGLGDEFLRHAMRTKILAHVVDMGASEGRNPIDDYQVIRHEIEEYNDFLKEKKEVVIATKMDLEGASNNLEEFKQAYPDLEVYPISSFNNTGINELLIGLSKTLENIPEVKLYNKEEFKIYKYEDMLPYTITKNNNVWIITGEDVEKVVAMTKFNEMDGVERLARILKSMGIEEDLKAKGAKPGDEVQILDYVFELKD